VAACLFGAGPKRLKKLRHVVDWTLHTETRRRVRIGGNHQAERFRPYLVAPQLGEGQEIALLWSVAVNLRRRRFASQGLLQSQIGDLQSTQVCDVFTKGQPAIDRQLIDDNIAVILLGDFRRPRLERFLVLRRPPVVQMPSASYWRPWSSKPCVSSWPITMPIAP